MTQRKVLHPERARRESRDAHLKAQRDAMTDADIEKAVADDPDTFIPDAEWWRHARVATPRPKKDAR